MNLVKWFRRNNKKVMAVVVIVIMIGFIGGTALTQLLQRNTGMRDVVAYLGDDTKVRRADLAAARRELEILQMLRADALLRMDIQGFFLGELLFSDRTASAAIVNSLKATIRRPESQLSISDEQVNAMYERLALPDVYWHCLQYEAQAAGISLDNDEVARWLGQLIPELFGGASYRQVVGEIMSRVRLPEDQIIATFGKLLAVREYANIMCSSEDVTTQQIMHAASIEQEGVDAGFVRFDASAFTEKLDDPDDAKLAEQFEKYKDFFAGAVSDDNPYGFGYKLPDRVQLEYIAVKLDDVRTIVEPPTQDEMGDYYNRNKAQFTEEVEPDPNDPNSETERTKGYAEVVDTIEKDLMNSRILAKTEVILQQARTVTERGLQDVNDAEIAALSTEQFRKKLGETGDYGTVAASLSDEYKIKVYTGLTGMLGPIELQTDEQLSRLVIRGYGNNPVVLSQVVFAVDELQASVLGPFDAPKPRMYGNIGPVRDWMTEEYGHTSGRIMAIVRIVQARKALAPESIDQTYKTNSFVFDPNEDQTDEDVYSVREKVVEDVKKLIALDTAKITAEDFIAQAVKNGWQIALDNVNKSYKEQYEQDANDPNQFRIQNSGGLRRISTAALDTWAVQRQGDPAGLFRLHDIERNKRTADQLYSLVPRDKTTTDELPLVVEVKPEMSLYAIKNISVKRLWKEDYEQGKVKRLSTEDYARSQSLAAVHFNPENILKRLKVRWAGTDDESADADAPEKSEAAP
ncbi:MAG: hypothetical protein ACYSWQ_15420 [Planctomycetota bacterium]|jgi:hypothetical protein